MGGINEARANQHLRTSSRDEAADERDRAAADRDDAASDRDHAASGRDHSEAEADQVAADRDHAAADRDDSQAEADQRTSNRDHATADRGSAAADREQAVADRIAAMNDREQARAELHHAHHDELTGALGREIGTIALEREINRARHGSGRLVLAYVDVDGLKQVNDDQGHAAGDALLRDVVEAIGTQLRSYDLIVRVGGDEFVCMLGDSVPDDVRRRFQGIQAVIDETHPGGSISVGFAALRPKDTLEQLMKRGDAALYEAKHEE